MASLGFPPGGSSRPESAKRAQNTMPNVPLVQARDSVPEPHCDWAHHVALANSGVVDTVRGRGSWAQGEVESHPRFFVKVCKVYIFEFLALTIDLVRLKKL